MSKPDRGFLSAKWLVTAFVAAIAPRAHSAERLVDQTLAADSQGTVEIHAVAGRIEILAWDRAEIAVSGALGSGVERLDLTSAAGRAQVRVVLPEKKNRLYVGDGKSTLVIHVPRASSISVAAGSAQLNVQGVAGRQELQSLSGSVETEVRADTRVKSLSGNVTLHAREEAQVDVETMTGDVVLTVAEKPAGAFNIQTQSGKIDNCFGPRPIKAAYGPGSRLTFGDGADVGKITVLTTSGDVRLCTIASVNSASP